jgi:hypothetical protein
MGDESDKILEHKHRKSKEMEAGDSFGKTFIITSQAAKTCHPSERTFNDPAAWQQDEALFRLWQFDDFQVDSFGSGSLFGRFTV